MGNEASGSDHIGCHSIADKHYNVFRLADGVEVFHLPVGSGSGAVVVGQHSFIVAGFGQFYTSVSFRCYVDEGWLLGSFGKEVYTCLSEA